MEEVIVSLMPAFQKRHKLLQYADYVATMGLCLDCSSSAKNALESATSLLIRLCSEFRCPRDTTEAIADCVNAIWKLAASLPDNDQAGASFYQSCLLKGCESLVDVLAAPAYLEGFEVPPPSTRHHLSH